MKYKIKERLLNEVTDYLMERRETISNEHSEWKKSHTKEDIPYMNHLVEYHEYVSEMIKELKYVKVVSDLKKGIPIQIDLKDGVEMNEKHPTTFNIPSDEEKDELKVGDVVKIIDKWNSERFWVEIKDFITDDLMVCIVTNDLLNNQPYDFGDELFVTKRNIIHTEKTRIEIPYGEGNYFQEKKNENEIKKNK